MINRSTNRPDSLQQLFDLLKTYFEYATVDNHHARHLYQQIFSALQARTGNIDTQTCPVQLPACQYLNAAIETICDGPHYVTPFAEAITQLNSLLVWHPRTRANNLIGNEDQNIANCTLVGRNGLEQRDDVQIGMTIMAPETLFADHSHPPTEIYAILSAGSWRQNDQLWHQPHMGGLIYNPANIVHAFKSHQAPLLAIWCLM